MNNKKGKQREYERKITTLRSKTFSLHRQVYHGQVTFTKRMYIKPLQNEEESYRPLEYFQYQK